MCFLQVNITLEKSEFDKKMEKAANQFPWKEFNDTDIKRQFRKLTDIGTNALENKDQLKLVCLCNCMSQRKTIWQNKRKNLVSQCIPTKSPVF